MSSDHWMQNFTVSDDDIDFLMSILLENEKPLSSADLARALIDARISDEVAAARERYADTQIYTPARAYEVGQRLVFPAFDYRIGVVEELRPGDNPEYGDFSVIAVRFEDNGDKPREFATELDRPHKLNEAAETGNGSSPIDVSADDILSANYDEIVGQVDNLLEQNPDLVAIAGKWFPRDLMLEINEGHLNLAEAVLDMLEGGPLPVETILEQIGGVDDAPAELQTFSLNEALHQDRRFDEVGPTGQILWYLQRLEPEEVLETPLMLRYNETSYDRDALSQDMLRLEAEIADEYSPVPPDADVEPADRVTLTLIYPHRRIGTLPLNYRLERIFPTARRTDRIAVTLVDGQDGEEYSGWVVRAGRYVYGLDALYRKHELPVGAYITVRPGDAPDKIVIDFDAYRARTEWIRLIKPVDKQVTFENEKRAIGADYDDLMIVGVDDVEAVDALFVQMWQSGRAIGTLLRQLVAELSRLTPQGTVHAKTLYSVVNVLYRCPPGPIFAALRNDPDFESVGNHYWKLTSST